MPRSTSRARCSPDSMVVFVPIRAIEEAGSPASRSANASTPASTMPCTGAAGFRLNTVRGYRTDKVLQAIRIRSGCICAIRERARSNTRARSCSSGRSLYPRSSNGHAFTYVRRTPRAGPAARRPCSSRAQMDSPPRPESVTTMWEGDGMAEEEYRRQKTEDSLPRRSRPAGRLAKAGSQKPEADVPAAQAFLLASDNRQEALLASCF